MALESTVNSSPPEFAEISSSFHPDFMSRRQHVGMDSQPPLLDPVTTRRTSFALKLLVILGLIIVLQVPVVLTDGVLKEREKFQAQATGEISAIWGRAQQLRGPILEVPYVYRMMAVHQRVVEGKVISVEEMDRIPAVAYFLPESLSMTGSVDPELRHRGIYDTVVYSSRIKLAGVFRPDFAQAGIGTDRIDWGNARVVFGVSDLHGVRAVSDLAIPGYPSAKFESGEGSAELGQLTAKVPLNAAGEVNFSTEISFQGSERLEIVPVGKETSVSLTSNWRDPSFIGASLPVSRQVTTNGFNATWQSSHLSRDFAQAWSSRTTLPADVAQKFQAASFGLRFMQPTTGYAMSERAQKYALLFFVLIFAVFFLFEVTSSLRIHPLQYGLVGAGLCLFFLGFLALSELMTVGLAYGIASGACTLLVSLYAWSFLRTGGRTLVIFGGLGATYGYLYFILRSQDYALVAGTVALFGMLALVMFCTRRLNWYDLRDAKAEAGR